MARAFWTLEDGSVFSGRWTGIAYLMELITDELKTMSGAENLYNDLEKLVYLEENGDEYNGFGGFMRGNETIMFDIDLRAFTPQNQEFFWKAAQLAMHRLQIRKDSNDDGIVYILTVLLGMHKQIKRGEKPQNF